MASSSRSISSALAAVGDGSHVADHRNQLARHGRVRVAADRGLGHVLGQVAHALEVRRDVQRAHDQPKVGRDRRLPGDQRVHLVLDLAVEPVHHHITRDHALSYPPVRAEQRVGRALHRAADLVGHRYQKEADLFQVGVKLRAHLLSSRQTWGCHRCGVGYALASAAR